MGISEVLQTPEFRGCVIDQHIHQPRQDKTREALFNEMIQLTGEVKYLGLALETNLTRKKHLNVGLRLMPSQK